MTRHSEPCESRVEALSLLAADCLPADEAETLRAHLQECPACRLRFHELSSLCSELAAAVPPVDDAAMRRIAQGVRSGMTTSRTSERSRWPGVLPAALALGLLVAALVVAQVVRPVGEAVRPTPPPVAGGADSPDQSEQEDVAQPPEEAAPTLIVLRQAALESEESLDRLLARQAGSMQVAPLFPQSYRKGVVE